MLILCGSQPLLRVILFSRAYHQAVGRRPSKKTEEVLRAAYRAFNERDVDAAIELMHPDVDCRSIKIPMASLPPSIRL